MITPVRTSIDVIQVGLITIILIFRQDSQLQHKNTSRRIQLVPAMA